MNKTLVQNVTGTRDFYPEDFVLRDWLYQKMRKVSALFGYQEYDGPEIEYITLYADKTSEEILAEQVFTLKDRDDRTLVLRPELTPTFARLVAQKSQQLIQPIRWFMFGRGWRYEKPQKGRGREFFQWEINVLGPETPEADAEILAIAGTFFKEIGLTPDEVIIRVNDRSYFEGFITSLGIEKDKYMPLLRIIDRKEKVSQEEFDEMLFEQGLSDEQVEKLNAFFKDTDVTKAPWLSKVFAALDKYEGIRDYIVYDPIIARGFDYYTRTVFEAWDKTGGLKRSLFGGGRFDNLTATIGGDRIPGVGMAPGDMPIMEVLKQFNKLPDIRPQSAVALVTIFDESTKEVSLEIANTLRSVGIRTELWVEPGIKLEKQLKYADSKNIPYVIIIGPDEAKEKKVTLKDLQNRTQTQYTIDELLRLLQTK